MGNKITAINIFYTIVLIMVSMQVFAQTYPITGINILLPSSPDANTTSWGTGKSQFMITATAESAKERIDPSVEESKLLVIIKKGGNKVCGAYTENSAPASNFNTVTMVWSGKNAASLLGQRCILPPGDYEISVQFFGYRDGKIIQLSDEKTKTFLIKGDEQPVSTEKPHDAGDGTDAADNKPGFAVSIQGGLGNIVFGAFSKKVIYCGKIKSVTRIRCAGGNPQTGLQSYYITMVLTNNPVDQVKSCDFVVNAVTALNKGTITTEGETLPITIAANATITYTFKYTPSSLREDNAKFSIKGTWGGDAGTPLELKPEIKLPACINCDCGPWSPLIINREVKYDCGYKNIIPWKCNQPINFTSTYQCGSNNESCQATTSWEIDKDGVSIKTGDGTNSIADAFTPTANGTYTITLNASCNGVKCPPCTYTIAIEDCKTCDCGTWSSLAVNNMVKFDSGVKNNIPWKCNQPFSFTSAYRCGLNNQGCQAATSWEIDKDGVSIKTGSGNIDVADAFTPTANGVYTITLNADCNGIKCPPAIYNVVIEDCTTCDCGNWVSPLVNIRANGTVVSGLKCGESVTLSKGSYSFAIPDYNCSLNNASCAVSYSWSVQGGPVVVNGTRQTFNYNFGQAGTYTIDITPLCGGKKCQSCKLQVIVQDNLPPVEVKKPEKKRTVNSNQHYYYVISPEYAGEVVSVKDTLFLQIQNNYSSGSNQLIYTILNLSNDKTSRLTKLAVTNNQGMIRIALPLQNSVVLKGETGQLIMGDYKKYYYISFKRN